MVARKQALIFYAQLFQTLFKNSFSAQSQYRFNFLIRFLAALLELVVILGFFYIIFRYTSAIGSWSFKDITILIVTFDLQKNLLTGLFVKNLSKIEDMLLNGKFDLLLTLPVNNLFYLSFQNISLGHLIQAIVPSAILLYMFTLIPGLHMIDVLIFILTLLSGLVIGYSLWIIVMSLSFYIVKVKYLHEIYLNLLQLGKNPSSIYPVGLQMVLKYIFPVLMICAFPVEILLRFARLEFVIVIIVSAFFSIKIAQRTWNMGVERYDSVGG